MNEVHVSSIRTAWKEFICSTTCYSNDKWMRALGFCSMKREMSSPLSSYHDFETKTIVWFDAQHKFSSFKFVSLCLVARVHLPWWPVYHLSHFKQITLFFSYGYLQWGFMSLHYSTLSIILSWISFFLSPATKTTGTEAKRSCPLYSCTHFFLRLAILLPQINLQFASHDPQ